MGGAGGARAPSRWWPRALPGPRVVTPAAPWRPRGTATKRNRGGEGVVGPGRRLTPPRSAGKRHLHPPPTPHLRRAGQRRSRESCAATRRPVCLSQRTEICLEMAHVGSPWPGRADCCAPVGLQRTGKDRTKYPMEICMEAIVCERTRTLVLKFRWRVLAAVAWLTRSAALPPVVGPAPPCSLLMRNQGAAVRPTRTPTRPSLTLPLLASLLHIPSVRSGPHFLPLLLPALCHHRPPPLGSSPPPPLAAPRRAIALPRSTPSIPPPLPPLRPFASVFSVP